MILRPARSDDASEICAIWNAVIRHSQATFTTEDKTPDGVRAQIDAGPFIVAEAAGSIAGFATYAPFRKGPGYARTFEHSVHVAECCRGRGLGRALMTRIEEVAREQRAGSLIAAISGANPGAVIFHANLGFVQVGHIPGAGWKNGEWLDLVLMQKTLAPATRHTPDIGDGTG